MANPIKISVVGASGRMGRMLLQAIIENENAILVGASEQTGHTWVGKDVGTLVFGKENGIIVSDKPIDVILKSQAIVDFTHPDASVAYAALAAQARIVHVIGTTGFSKNQLEGIELAAQHATVIRAGNMSLGVNLLMYLTEIASQSLGKKFLSKIYEVHHKHKIDYPSGTALMIAQGIADGRSKNLNNLMGKKYLNKKSFPYSEKINFNSIRKGEVIGEHEVKFSSGKEIITLNHESFDRALYSEGALTAAAWLMSKKAGLYSMRDLLNFK